MSKEPTKEERNKKSNFDLNKVDYEWIEKTTDKKELYGAYDALELTPISQTSLEPAVRDSAN